MKNYLESFLDSKYFLNGVDYDQQNYIKIPITLIHFYFFSVKYEFLKTCFVSF